MAQIDKVNRLRDVIIEASLHALLLDVTHDVSRESNDGKRRIAIPCFPLADLAAGLIPILARHVEITLLHPSAWPCQRQSQNRESYQDERVITMIPPKDPFRALDTV